MSVDLWTVRQASTAVREEAAQVVEICNFARRPDLAAEFIRRGMTPAAVTRALEGQSAAKPAALGSGFDPEAILRELRQRTPV